MKKTLPLTLSTIILTINACSPQVTAPPAPLPVTEPATSIVVTPSQVPTAEDSGLTLSWNTYNNPKYGYSLNYPHFYDVVTVSDEHVEIGEKIVVEVWNIDPATSLGDGAVIESAADVQLSGYSAKLLTGYIGSVGGYIPQQIRRFVVERNASYFVVTLYALGLHATEGDVSQIVQLNPEDVSLFDTMVTSMQIP